MKAIFSCLVHALLVGMTLLSPAVGAPQVLQNNICENCFLSLGSYPWPETEVNALKDKIDSFPPNKSFEADAVRIRLAYLYNQLGRYDDAATLLFPFTWGASQNTELTAIAHVLWCLLWADVAWGKGEAVDSYNQITAASLSLHEVKSPEILAELSRLTKTARFARTMYLIPIADYWDKKIKVATEGQSLPRDILCILHSTLTPEASRLVEGKVEIRSEALEQIGALRPWKDALLRTAAVLAIELNDLDQLVLNNTELAGALRMNREADLYSARGNHHKAIQLRQRAIATFQRQHNMDLQLEALAGIEKDGMQAGSIASMLAVLSYGQQLILSHEERMTRLGSNSFLYQLRHIEAYKTHRDLLFRLAEQTTQLPDEMRRFILQEVVLHADRLHLRPVRRQMALLRTVARTESARKRLSAKIAAAKPSLYAATTELAATQSKGVSRENLRSEMDDQQRTVDLIKKSIRGDTIILESGTVSTGKKMIAEGGAYVKRNQVQRDIRRFMDSSVLTDMHSINKTIELPTDWDRLVAGMTDDDALIVFIGSGFDFERPLRVAIITKSGPPHIITLSGATLGEVRVLVDAAIENLSTNSSEKSTALAQLARILWYPLGELPHHLTIIPNLQLIGLPFEALPVRSGGVVNDSHSIRYAIGLDDGIGCHKVMTRPSRALIIGTEDFHRLQLDPLPEVRLEVDTVRRLLQEAHIEVIPNDPFPRTGVSVLSADPKVGIIHVSTHSVKDSADALFDRLAFPDEDVMGIDLASSPRRADLAVFSACGLLQNRGKGAQPVSGTITASLATISPQVVTTFWSVESQSTRMFMTVFYERLLETGKPEVALALAKKMFYSPVQLKEWALRHGVYINDLHRFSSPYFWAAFALVTSS